MRDKLVKVKKPAKLLKAKKKSKEGNKSMKMQAMSVDDFLGGFMNDKDMNDSNIIDNLNKPNKKVLKSKMSNGFPGLKTKKILKNDTNDDNEEKEGDDGEDVIKESDLEEEFKSHKIQLKGLKETDPEFYKYLEENDQDLLNFEDSEDDSENEKNEKFHKAPDSLEVGSDESDYEPDEEVVNARKGKGNRVTSDMIEHWQEKLQSKKNFAAVREVAEAFHSALGSISSKEDSTSLYKVQGATMFNAVIRLCMTDFLPGILKCLKIQSGSKEQPKKSKSWNKVKPILKVYLMDLLELSTVSSPNMLRVLLKHFHQMAPFVVCFPSVAPRFLKRVCQLWAMDEDVVRILAFLCALRLSNLRTSLLKQALKVMHLTYVRNTKFVSPNSLPGINFMRQSLCELFALDDTISYHMAFLYIRQLAIHLRNAIILKKKDSFKTVYNWAYISSLHLWADLFSTVSNKSPLRSLIYPLVQIIIGSIKLIPSSQFYPLRFHCCHILINLSNKTGIFIPVLPFLLEVMRDFDFNREHKKLSMKPLDLTCLLRCSKSQMKENGFKDAIIENLYVLMMEYLMGECHRISFPDVTVPCVIQMKKFLKSCTVVNYTKKMKSILDKISENSKYIETERRKLNVRLDDLNGVEAAEIKIRTQEPPFFKYYQNWKKIHLQQQARKLTNNHKLGDFKLPVLYKTEKKRNRMETTPVGPPELFPSDEESESEKIFGVEGENVEEEPPKKKMKKKIETTEKEDKKKSKKGIGKITKEKEDDDYGEDIIEDLNYSDLE